MVLQRKKSETITAAAVATGAVTAGVDSRYGDVTPSASSSRDEIPQRQAAVDHMQHSALPSKHQHRYNYPQL